MRFRNRVFYENTSLRCEDSLKTRFLWAEVCDFAEFLQEKQQKVHEAKLSRRESY